MKPLLEIHSVPISIEYKVNRGKFQRVDNATVEVSRNKRGYQLKSRPIKISIDAYEQNRAPVPKVQRETFQPIQQTTAAQTADTSQLQGRYSAQAHMVGDSQMQMDIQVSNEIAQQAPLLENIAVQQHPAATAPMDTDLYPFPENLSVMYEIDKSSFEFLAESQLEFEFVPGSIEFTVKEYPKLTIEYVGDPIYVPPSADPNYVAVDTIG